MGKHDLDDAAWDDWIDTVGASIGVDGAGVDITFIHALTQLVAREFTRPMAPVSAYLLGLAHGTHPGRPIEELRDALVAAVRAD